ncbi:RNA polymerase I-specific transcription initiation factor RRN6-like protein [Aspergillus avenaceus]|uniref:RNA polymerase I-specific transcription initiation factor RRN6-like protein n=1 Tax=Aspergillus avenaceus TaxID=36643 RepID=A0A5N6TLW0_ASPAV|nr:RNA polymerase I-specific transcription initiation factor RRN6-like protein [Aspergillus avenaceus]
MDEQSFENKGLLPRAHPELAACWPLANEETFSHVINTTSESCDPLVSSLLDLGYAVSLENDDSGSRTVPIAVVASGECGNAISFYIMEENFVDLELNPTTQVRVPSIRETESTEWSASGAPVCQICFARPAEEKPTWVAARFPHSTLLFRPVYHRHPIPAHVYHGGNRTMSSESRHSRLDANLLVEISNSQTGGFMHAAVSFNPWYQKQVGIVDVRGNWSIWEISGRYKQSKNNWSATCITSGSLPWLGHGDGRELNGHPRHDGWAAIEWVGSVNNIIISDRRCPMFYRVELGQVYSYHIELGLKKKSEWILDIKRSGRDLSHVFILTTSRVFWFDVNIDFHPDTRARCLIPRLSWRHFRDPEDTTLQLAPLTVYDELDIVLYSRLSAIALTFHCPSSSKEYRDNDTVYDPFVLEIPPMSSSNAGPQLNGMLFSSLVFREVGHLPSLVGKGDHDTSLRLVKLFAVDSRLSVRETLYVRPSEKADSFEPNTGRGTIQLKRRYDMKERSQPLDFGVHFIVDDWAESVAGLTTHGFPDVGITNIAPLVIPKWSIDYTRMYDVVIGKRDVSGQDGSQQGTEKSLQDCLEKLRFNMLAQSASRPTSQTLLEILGHPPLNVIDQDAQDTERFLFTLLCSNTPTQPNKFIQLFNSLGLLRTESVRSTGSFDSNLISIYDQAVNHWLTPLPRDIPGRTRILKEQVIRNVAADLFLTQVAMTRKNVYGLAGTEPDGQNLIHDDYRSLPVTGQIGYPIKDDHTATGNTESLYASLAAFASFESAEQCMPRRVTDLLHHWQPGTNPSAYNWERTMHLLETDEVQRESSSTMSKRRSRKKMSQNVMLDPSVPSVPSVASTVREWGSQPEIHASPVARIQSSQVMEDGLPMTQVERGTFGGREHGRKSLVKAKKKKRAAGF